MDGGLEARVKERWEREKWMREWTGRRSMEIVMEVMRRRKRIRRR